jgi:hypothetical protein
MVKFANVFFTSKVSIIDASSVEQLVAKYLKVGSVTKIHLPPYSNATYCKSYPQPFPFIASDENMLPLSLSESASKEALIKVSEMTIFSINTGTHVIVFWRLPDCPTTSS